MATRNGTWLHDLVEPDDEVDVVGVRCDADWCLAFLDASKPCGAGGRTFACGSVHYNRRERAAGRAEWDPETFGRPAANLGGVR